MTNAAQPTPIPAPEGFPVVWAQPGDEHRLWTRESMHAPGQIRAMDASIAKRWIDGGMNAAFEHYSMPVRNRYFRVNTYLYQSIFPFTFDPAELQRLGHEAERRVGEVLGRQLALWNEQWLPELLGIYADWIAVDHAALDDAGLAAHVRRVVDDSVHVWEIHFKIAFPMLMSMSLFDDFYRETLAAEDRYEAVRLLQGIENMSVKSDRALWQLSRRAVGSQAVLDALSGDGPDAIRAALAGTADGRDLLAGLDEWLGEYGLRSTNFLEVSRASLQEDPTSVLLALRDLVANPEADPYQELSRLAAEREQLIAKARETLAVYPEPVRGQFEFLLAAAQEGAVLQEDHNFWLDGRVTALVRAVVVELGRRLEARGLVDAAADVFHLEVEEAVARLEAGTDLRAVVAARVAELEQYAKVPAPPILGTLPPGPPPDDPVARAIDKMFGAPPRAPEAPGTLHGNAGSPGVVRGVARVIRSLDDAERLGRREILVAETTAPPWTPLFARVGGIVTDTGGILSHCAIVAREYAIPAVVGVGMGTVAIPDGALVEVDGDTGTVRLIQA